MKTIVIVILTICFIQVANSQGIDTLKGANPLTSGHYVPGIWDVRDYATPSPGLYVIDYNIFQTGDKYYDIDGNQVSDFNGEFGKTSLNIDVKGYSNAFVLFYAAPFTVLGAVYFASISPVFTTINSDLAYNRISQILNDTTSKSGNVNGDVSGFGDMTFNPFGLSWASDEFNLTFSYSLVAPTGRYTPGGSDNIGLGYWTNTVQTFGYVYPMKINGKPSQAMAIMAALTYEINSKIKDVSVTPGNRLTIEYGISQYLSNQIEIGIMGGNNFQITEDTGEDVWWNSSEMDQMGYVSFQFAVWPIVNQLYTAVKYNFDYGLKQRIKMQMIELNFIYVSGLLTGETK